MNIHKGNRCIIQRSISSMGVSGLSASTVICWQSSRVGASTTLVGHTAPSAGGFRPAFSAAVMMGTRKAAVLPLPVCAVTSTSSPSSTAGMLYLRERHTHIYLYTYSLKWYLYMCIYRNSMDICFFTFLHRCSKGSFRS